MLPKDTAQRLGIAKPTLRKWALEFAPWLSSGALAPGKGHERHYSTDDIKMLQRVQQLLGDRYTYDEVRERLGTPEDTSEPTEDATARQEYASIDAIASSVVVLQEQPELALLRQMLEAQSNVIEQQRSQLGSMERHIADQSTLIHQLQSQLASAETEKSTLQGDIRKIPRWLRLLLRV